ncbi:tRNA (guanosine(46)-N7)-methyltransferase TrmB [Actinomyces bowdenii]|uniref:tRNA (guanosine(46)-N7)-methyltransferase TrmB n=1 Tax=Actinomyces bowdenii TaxID=131109 RepID=UPI00214CA30F|nr:tRNA (guanosine(46)-N7)-methyltransferase TrmB [Actinomyces bowdenii]MCR2053316.1 tRNA (guanosine(46)-N7)-methyltransferase TrmB [Actinomyces bowdenii]
MAQQHPPRSHAIPSRVRSYSRAGGRMRPAQAQALSELGPRYVVEVPRDDAVRTVAPGFHLEPEALFGHAGQARPLIVEVGPGSGEALLAHAASHPGADHLAIEVWETAIARMVAAIARQGLRNVRVVPADAAQVLARALPVSSASEVWVFFPDPWRKARHRKRRLVTAGFADSVARVLRPGGVWRMATDWADYAWQMRDVVEEVSALPAGLRPDATLPYFRHDDAGARPGLGAQGAVAGDPGNGMDPGSPAGVIGGWSERFAGRVMTRFEQRGLEAGRTVRDLRAVRTEVAWEPELGASMLQRLEAQRAAWDAVEREPWRLREADALGGLRPEGPGRGLRE